ncbi:hypothetical protein COU18_03155 [Candidatus Kaiserbacteria bacterium CG10_big_fil_rev_8_21_14_0_10_51_14]|uniref:Response regulatory domain-containing protein n=1 Tax=Candidatus Kaiserbacteria bacterium CG10_big_fil_rev_8_21_14_0_10_51_14 TaxID=1974610 RepID=A0A2H0UB54_9BACT|nr:MAG: hypothetical protein COU18_03155 [Candidatus Kaiserbacteria bacterium CG10_big_fil_rev_8_21_14_0_10_51_14]
MSASAPKLLLIVEDEARMAHMLKETLESEGFTVSEARSAENAFASAESDRPDLILLDIMLPGIDGMSFLKNMRASAWGKKIPVIILTNVSPDDQIMEGIVRDGPSYYIIKAETSMDDIVAKVKTTLGIQQMQM